MRGISNSITTKMSSLTLPTKVRLIRHQSLVQILKETLSDAKTVLFLEEDLALSALLLPVIEEYRGQGKLVWIKEISLVLTPKAILQALSALDAFNADQFLVIGNDAALDLAKAVSLVLPWIKKTNSEEALFKKMTELGHQEHIQRVTLKAVLTTSQCGSALMGWVRVLDEATQTLIVLEHPDLAFDDALIFMDESVSLSPSQLLTSGMKALSQAADAYWSTSATPVIRHLSLNAIRKIVTTLPILLKKTDHHEAREQMMIGSLMAAFAISNTRLSAATSTGLIINALTGMDPGLAGVLILPELLRHNLGSIQNPESLYEAFNIDNPEGLMSWIETNAQGLASTKLSDYAVESEDLNRLSMKIEDLGALKNNTVALTADHLTAILKRHL